MSTSRNSGGSATLCVQFTLSQCPTTFERASAVFAAFGEVARVDMSLASALGLIVVTFFDVRSAELAVQTFKQRAKRLLPEAHDFRTVAISSSLFATLPGYFAGFQTFGEIAGVAIAGEDMLIEFYDMRAAQRLSLAVPGSVPQPHAGALPSGLGPHLGSWAALETGVMPAPATVTTSSNGPAQKAHVMAPVTPGAVPPGTAIPAAVNGASTNGARGGPGATAANSAATHTPAREKLDAKDLAKFDIIPEKIRAGEDSRTTVMVRNIPRVCSREDLAELLKRCGTDNYGFFYMPFDKRRDIHCGFAFIDFSTPSEVLKLYEVLKEWPQWWPAPPNGGAPPAVSYARLQGQEQLMKHFSLSAVMFDSDSRKRPVFYREGMPGEQAENEAAQAHGDCVENEEEEEEEVEVAAEEQMQPQLYVPQACTDDCHQYEVDLGLMQPRYVQLPCNGQSLGEGADALQMAAGMLPPGFAAGLTTGLSDFRGLRSEAVVDSTLLGA